MSKQSFQKNNQRNMVYSKIVGNCIEKKQKQNRPKIENCDFFSLQLKNRENFLKSSCLTKINPMMAFSHHNLKATSATPRSDLNSTASFFSREFFQS